MYQFAEVEFKQPPYSIFSSEKGDDPQPSRDEFRNAMAFLGAAVNVVTTDGPAGRGGFTATAVCSVSDTPPTLLVCLNRGSYVYKTLRANRVLCVNTLAGAQKDISALFGGRASVEERFAAARWSQGVSGSPMLDGALINFDCKVADMVEAGSHDVLLCSVLSVGIGPKQGGLVYFDRNYHSLSADESS